MVSGLRGGRSNHALLSFALVAPPPLALLVPLVGGAGPIVLGLAVAVVCSLDEAGDPEPGGDAAAIMDGVPDAPTPA